MIALGSGRRGVRGAGIERHRGISVSLKVLGVRELMRAMEDWKVSIQKRIIYNAVRKCGPIIKRKIKPLVPRESGTLKKSIGARAYMHTRRFGAGVVVGPRKGFSQMVTVRTEGRLRGRYRSVKKAGEITAHKQRKRVPENYSHLVEFGHRTVTGGTVIRVDGKRAGIQRATRRYETREFLGRQSKYRRLRKQGATYQKAVGPSGQGTVTGKVLGAHFMSRGWRRAQPMVAATIRLELQRGIAKAAAKAAAKNRSH